MSRAKILIQGSLVRAGYGVAALAYPKLIATVAGLDELDPNARYINRILGGRDLILAGSTVIAAMRGRGGSAVQANIFAETADTAALVTELQDRGQLDRALMIGLALNVFGHLTWLRAAAARVPEVVEELIDASTEEQPRRRLKRPKVSRPSVPQVAVPAVAAKLATPDIDLDAAKKKARKQAKRARKQVERTRKQAKAQATEVRKQAGAQADQVRKQAKRARKRAEEALAA